MIPNIGAWDPALLPRPLVSDSILVAISNWSGVSIDQLLGHGNFARAALARFVVMYLMREVIHLSYPRIGEILGGRDHSTIIHGCNVIRRRIAASPQFAATIEALKAEVRS